MILKDFLKEYPHNRFYQSHKCCNTEEFADKALKNHFARHSVLDEELEIILEGHYAAEAQKNDRVEFHVREGYVFSGRNGSENNGDGSHKQDDDRIKNSQGL